jgi:hypothetical protein
MTIRRLASVAAFAVTLAASLSCGDEVPYDRFPAGANREDFMNPPAVDPLAGMDTKDSLTPQEIRGRNAWMLWTAGNQEFWDWMARYGYGTVDFLKVIDSRGREQRFAKMGLINDPNLRQAAHADSLGVWMDSIATREPEAIKDMVYGRPSGIMGLRVFPNPLFNAAARAAWDGAKYYTDSAYFTNPNLIRPYIVGMSCGFCHVSHHPLNPPKDPEHPEFANMSATIGAQYFRTAPIFAPAMDTANYVYQLLLGYREGTTDTSLIPSDQIFNPSNMNSIFEIAARLKTGSRHEFGPSNRATPGVTGASASVPQILKDGADNVGVIGALSRVFVNIGEYWELWTTLHRPLTGTKKQSPFPVTLARERSDYWNATEARLEDIAAYFTRVATPMHLEKAPGGAAYITRDKAVLARGGMVFANECAECHSTRQPPGGRSDTAAAKAFYRASVAAPDFRTENWLSTDERFPVSAPNLGTNACRALGTNAMQGHIWDNFSSATYQNDSTRIDSLAVKNLYAREPLIIGFPKGGQGYYRPASLVSIWATAPFLHNNALGEPTHDPSVAGRMKAFDDAVTQLLWPQRRLPDSLSVSRTRGWTNLRVPKSDIPSLVLKRLEKRLGADSSAFVSIGPIPPGTPVALLASIRMQLSLNLDYLENVWTLLAEYKDALKEIKEKDLKGAAQHARLRQLAPDLVKLSNCPDFVENRGHYYGRDLTDQDKRALIEFLKTL